MKKFSVKPLAMAVAAATAVSANAATHTVVATGHLTDITLEFFNSPFAPGANPP